MTGMVYVKKKGGTGSCGAVFFVPMDSQNAVHALLLVFLF